MNIAQARDLHDVKTARLRSRLVRLARVLLFASVGALVLRSLVYAPFSIPSQSMAPAFVQGDTVFVARWPYGLGVHNLPLDPGLMSFIGARRLAARLPTRGDVIIFKTPRDNRSNFIKRVIGLPGDTVALRGGRLWLNGAPLAYRAACPEANCKLIFEDLPEQTIAIHQDSAETGSHFGPVVVPADMLFLLGDNRLISADSRFSIAQGGTGMVPVANVIGRADIILFSTACNGQPLCRFAMIPA